MSEAWGRRTNPGSPQRLHIRQSLRSRLSRASVLMSALLLVATACRGVTDLAMMRQAQPGDILLIKHVIVIMQENRSFDFLFRNVPTTDHLHKNFRPLDVLVMSSLVPALRGDGTGSMTGR